MKKQRTYKIGDMIEIIDWWDRHKIGTGLVVDIQRKRIFPRSKNYNISYEVLIDNSKKNIYYAYSHKRWVLVNNGRGSSIKKPTIL